MERRRSERYTPRLNFQFPQPKIPKPRPILPRIINLDLPEPSSADEAGASGHADAHAPGHESSHAKGGVAIVVGALGVVFGDIGTSPLYALRECFSPIHGIAVAPDNILGLLSLIFWCLALIITVKYVGIVLEADNRGEGGILALSALLVGASRNWRIWTPVSAVGLFGASLFFGDGFITPAISVMSAIEGLAVAAPNLHNVVMPGAALILTCLFFVQKRGTAVMGRAFGPVIIAWFATLAVLGVRGILQAPEVLAAINPAHAARFFMDNGVAGFITLSSVFLCVTGGEALYADMGHFGRGPIRKGWLFVVLPALLLNYFGQGALLLTDPQAIQNPFYLLAPAWALVPLILLATAATVIASQAVISGVFSIARQAINMGYLPRLKVLHSSEHSIGQVYVPAVNWLLFICTLTLVILFGSSSALAGAYGIAIVCDMVVTSIMVIMLLRIADARGNRAVIGVLAIILVIELFFFASNILKLDDGGWIPLAIASGIYLLMSTWREGRRALAWLVAKQQVPVREFLASIAEHKPNVAPGTAVYLVSDAGGIPRALSQNLRFNGVMHERIILLTFVSTELPRVPADKRVDTHTISPGIYRVIARYGFMEVPDILSALRGADAKGVEFRPDETTYVIGRENPVFSGNSGMPLWRKRLFAVMGRNSQLASIHFGVPAHRVVEISSQVNL
ncbi:MAG: potassium transporter Kup [Steroidobacteraceae bacterium]